MRSDFYDDGFSLSREGSQSQSPPVPYPETHSDNSSDDYGKRYEGADGESRLIEDTNKLLASTNIVAKKIRSLAELERVASSIFVALFEHVYHTRIDEIIRDPKSQRDYEYNAQLVVDRLSEQINYSLSHITGRLIVDGDLTALKNLVDIFMRILTFTRHGVRSTSTLESGESMLRESFGFPEQLPASMESISVCTLFPVIAGNSYYVCSFYVD
jgi:hypothetical protein